METWKLWLTRIHLLFIVNFLNIFFVLLLFVMLSVVIVKDYSEEFRDITKSRIKDSVPSGGITLLTQKPVSDDLPVRAPAYMYTIQIFISIHNYKSQDIFL